jgi:hypothetical protein
MQTHAFIVALSETTIKTWAPDSDTAVNLVLKAEGAPFSAFLSVYQEDPVPHMDAKYGAPMGRMSRALDHDGTWRAEPIALDEGGYDDGGAYWGLRRCGESIYSVQDGMGNIAFVDAQGPDSALLQAAA